MNPIIQTMMRQYDCRTEEDYANALKEIIQEIALLGLWRSKFFERAAFYGGTALRILYDLNRFSEDLDFCLYQPDADFSLRPYHHGIESELAAFGFDVEFKEKKKTRQSAVLSAFLRANTREHILVIGAPHALQQRFQSAELVKIKMEVDTDPVTAFSWEARDLFLPIPFSIRTLTESSLFAGKLHAVLCRQWGRRVKGRDWYDFLWFIGRKTKVDLPYLEEKVRQSGHYARGEALSLAILQDLLRERIEELSIDRAKEDIIDFVPNPNLISGWTKGLFLSAVDRLGQAYTETE